MPKKKGKKGKKKASPSVENADILVKKFMKRYEQNCKESNTLMSPTLRKTLKNCVENSTIFAKAIVQPTPIENQDDPRVSLEPLIKSLREERYVYVKDLHVWDVPQTHQDMAALALLLEKGFYTIRQLELMDCLIESHAVKRLAESFMLCQTLTIINLDYNEFGDQGCAGLCAGLKNNRTVISLSLNYCDLGVASGGLLGEMIAASAVRDLYLDGNSLECEGAMDIIKLCVERAEFETYQKEEEARLKAEAEAIKTMAEEDSQYGSYAREPPDRVVSAKSIGKGKKKTKGKKKKKEPPPPPAVGPWIHKLHLADNGIDGLGNGPHFAPVICMRLFRRLLTHSECLSELDLEDNLIGDLGGREVMEALTDRKEANLSGVKVRTTHRMNSETFATIIKLGSGLKKKKKKGKGKKKVGETGQISYSNYVSEYMANQISEKMMKKL